MRNALFPPPKKNLGKIPYEGGQDDIMYSGSSGALYRPFGPITYGSNYTGPFCGGSAH